MEMLSRRLRIFVPFFGLAILSGGNPHALFPQSVPARLTYSRTFKGSTPEYLALTVDSKGSGTYEGRKLDEAQVDSPRPFQLSAATTGRIFDLVSQLHDFHSVELESHKKVANLGEKTFTYQLGAEVNKVTFNYTENRTARQLVDLFEALGAVEGHIAALEFDMKYDPLGLSQELLQIQIELNDKSLVDPEVLVPTLEKIAHGSRFLHLAQARAQQIIANIQPNP